MFMKRIKKTISISLLLLIVGCMGIKRPSLETGELEQHDQAHDYSEEIWICHHPNTQFHNQLCIEEYYPNGCYVEGDDNKFCWRLNEEECSEHNKEEWLFKACNFLGGHN